jgi:oxygen-independent coproporphyrinogen III oxidase
VIERLMCDGAADTAALGAAFGRPADWCADELARLAEQAQDGLVRLDGGRIELTPAGRGLSRVVASVFDRYLAASEARHSLAV